LRRIFLLRFQFKRSGVFIFHFPIFKHKDACLALSVSAVVPVLKIVRSSELLLRYRNVFSLLRFPENSFSGTDVREIFRMIVVMAGVRRLPRSL
jgi:hypothetical protein